MARDTSHCPRLLHPAWHFLFQFILPCLCWNLPSLEQWIFLLWVPVFNGAVWDRMPGFAQLSQESAASLGRFIYPGLGIPHCSQRSLSLLVVLFISWFQLEKSLENLEVTFPNEKLQWKQFGFWASHLPVLSTEFSVPFFFWFLCEFGCHPEPCADLKLVFGCCGVRAPFGLSGGTDSPFYHPVKTQKQNPFFLAVGSRNVFVNVIKASLILCWSSGWFWAAFLPPVLLAEAGEPRVPLGVRSRGMAPWDRLKTQIYAQLSSTAVLSKGDESKPAVAMGKTIFLTHCLGCLPLGLHDPPKAREVRDMCSTSFILVGFFLNVNLKSA